jgi:transposase
MGELIEAFVGLDVAKAKHAVAIAEEGRTGEVRYFGEIDAEPASVRRMVAKLEKPGMRLHFCYEAGPTGYGLHRQLTAMGHACDVIAPSLIPRRAGDRVKTNRRDAIQLAKLLRAGELTPIWVPDEVHEAMRELIRSRDVAVADLRRKRQAISSMMLRYGLIYAGKKTWGPRHRQWLQAQKFAYPAQQLVLQDLILAAEHAAERLKRVETSIMEFLPKWSLAPVVDALQALRGIQVVTAATIMAEIGDLRRFDTPRQLMGYLGLVPGEDSTGESVKRLGITKAGNGRVRRALVESAWTYRHLPRTGKVKHYVHERVSPDVRDIALKAQSRLCARYRNLSGKGKKPTVAVTAIARELAGFVWAIGRLVQTT